jgi:hypothetical protein
MNLKPNEWQFIILLIKFHYMADNEQVFSVGNTQLIIEI